MTLHNLMHALKRIADKSRTPAGIAAAHRSPSISHVVGVVAGTRWPSGGGGREKRV